MGAQTDQCVAATVTGALKAGLKVTVVADAHGTWDWGGETADQIIARYNAAFADAQGAGGDDRGLDRRLIGLSGGRARFQEGEDPRIDVDGLRHGGDVVGLRNDSCR